MIDIITTVLLGAAAVYRVAFSLRHPPTLWRTCFTLTVVGVALATVSSNYGSYAEPLVGAWNLSYLVTHLLLVVTAGSVMMYVITLRHSIYTYRRFVSCLVGAGVVGVIQIITWLAAPIHDRPLDDLAAASSSLSVTVFTLTFMLLILAATSATARFCLRKAFIKGDVVRTISLILTGSACTLGSLIFAAYTVVGVLRYARSPISEVLKRTVDSLLPAAIVLLAAGTLTLLVAPSLVDLTRVLTVRKTLLPRWRELTDRYPEVRLNAQMTRRPIRRLENRNQRMTVEIYDAQRLASSGTPAR